MEKKREGILTLPSFKRDKLGEMVFTTLRDNILSGKLKEGDPLPPQNILAEQFGVSRTVMREAINKLSSLGLIESHQGRGTFVHSLTPSSLMEPMLTALLLDEVSIRELMETRYYLEGIIARLASKRAEPKTIDALERLIGLMEEHLRDGYLEAFAENDLTFHLTLAEASKNTILRRVLETI